MVPAPTGTKKNRLLLVQEPAIEYVSEDNTLQ